MVSNTGLTDAVSVLAVLAAWNVAVVEPRESRDQAARGSRSSEPRRAKSRQLSGC